MVALTGGIGSGKTTVSDLFAALGVIIIDSDILAREVVEPGQPALDEVIALFGEDIVNEAGGLNRKKLRERVFADPDKRKALETILHPRIIAEMGRRVSLVTDSYCIVCIPLLFETGRQSQFDQVLVVDVAPELQITRTLQRDGSPRSTIESILEAQVDRAQRLAFADHVIDNSGDIESVRQQVAQLHERFLELAGH